MKKLLFALLMTATLTVHALPPQVEADRLMLEIKGQIDAKQYAAAVENFSKVEKLPGIQLPDTFAYHYGVALAGMNKNEEALKKLDQYLTTAGSGGKFYKEALEKYNEVESKIKALSKATPEMIAIPGKNYSIGKYEVTQGQWKAIMGNNPSSFKNCGDDCPVENVSWNDAQEFIQKLNAKTGKQYRLPTGEEWKYACDGGSSHEYCGSDNLNDVAWYDKNSGMTTHPVGQKQHNGYGLHDMTGNVGEVMQDKNERGYYGLRGGCWFDNWPGALSAGRASGNSPTMRKPYFGFRLAMTLP